MATPLGPGSRPGRRPIIWPAPSSNPHFRGGLPSERGPEAQTEPHSNFLPSAAKQSRAACSEPAAFRLRYCAAFSTASKTQRSGSSPPSPHGTSSSPRKRGSSTPRHFRPVRGDAAVHRAASRSHLNGCGVLGPRFRWDDVREKARTTRSRTPPFYPAGSVAQPISTSKDHRRSRTLRHGVVPDGRRPSRDPIHLTARSGFVERPTGPGSRPGRRGAGARLSANR